MLRYLPHRNLDVVPDSAIELTGFFVHRSDRTKELTGKAKVGAFVSISTTRGVMKGIYTLLNPSASPDLEFHMLLCRAFWLPRELTAIIITAVYIPPQANTDQALREL